MDSFEVGWLDGWMGCACGRHGRRGVCLWGTPGPVAVDWIGGEDGAREWGVLVWLGLAAWPRRSGASEGEWDLPFQPVIDFGRAESRPRRTTTGTSEMGA